VSVGTWNGAPCTEDDPLRAASSGGAALPQTGSGYIKEGQGPGAEQKGQAVGKDASTAGQKSTTVENGKVEEGQQAVPMETDQPNA